MYKSLPYNHFIQEDSIVVTKDDAHSSNSIFSVYLGSSGLKNGLLKKVKKRIMNE
jgi:hypothetical protein